MSTKTKHNQNNLKKEITDLRSIRERYESDPGCSGILLGRLHELEREFLTDFFLMSTGVSEKAKPKKPAEPFKKSLQPES